MGVLFNRIGVGAALRSGVDPRGTCLQRGRSNWGYLGFAVSAAVSAACFLGMSGVVSAAGASKSAASQPAASQPASSLPAGWQQLAQADFVALCEARLVPATGSLATDKSKLAKYAWTAWLNNPQNTLTPDQIITLSTLGVSELSNADCALLKNVLLRHFPAATNVQPLSITSLGRLAGLIASRLALQAQISGWLQSWVDGHNGGTDLSLQDAGAAWDLCQVYMPATAPVFSSLAQSMWTKYLQVKEGWDPLADSDVMLYYNRLYGSLPVTSRVALCQNVWRRLNTHVPQMAPQLTSRDLIRIEKEILANASVSLTDLIPLAAGFLTTRTVQSAPHDLSCGVFLIFAFSNDPKWGPTVTAACQAAAANTVAMLSQNTPVAGFDEYVTPYLGKLFQSDADRLPLRNLLTSPVLENRLAAAQILTWSFNSSGKLMDWSKEVAGDIAAAQSDGDAKAFWTLVAGEIELGKHQDPGQVLDGEVDAKWKRPSLDKALTTAQGEPMKLLVLEQYSELFLQLHHPADGASLLASVIEQFSPQGQQKVKQLKQQLQANANYLEVQAAADGIAKLTASQATQLKIYQASLGRAQMDHNQKSVLKIQAAIAALQSQIQGAGTQPAGGQ